MPQKQRLRVWSGDLKKTSGGLEKKDLFKNKRGKIVSKRKSGQAAGANNLGKWLRKSGDTFGERPVGAPDPKAKEKQPSAAAKKIAVKAPKPMVHRPKPKPPQQAPKPKRKRAEPMKAGEKKQPMKVSVGNIIVPKPEPKPKKKEEWESWPNWIKRTIQKTSGRGRKDLVVEIKELREEGMSWNEVSEYLEGGSFNPIGLRKKVKKRLKATRRRGKRRSKKTLLQDVLD